MSICNLISKVGQIWDDELGILLVSYCGFGYLDPTVVVVAVLVVVTAAAAAAAAAAVDDDTTVA
jgi:hypothetical protein